MLEQLITKTINAAAVFFGQTKISNFFAAFFSFFPKLSATEKNEVILKRKLQSARIRFAGDFRSLPLFIIVQDVDVSLNSDQKLYSRVPSAKGSELCR